MARTFAQDGEDRIIGTILKHIGPVSRVAVEFGAGDGVTHSNTARLRQAGWRVVAFDREPGSALVANETITRENINEVFRHYGVPEDVDLVSIDIDGNDLHVWEALTYRPRIVVIEYNGKFQPTESVTVPYDAARVWDKTDYYGASVAALYRLARRKGYRLADYTISNLIFVRKDVRASGLRPWHVPSVARKRPDPLGRPWEAYR